MNRLLSNINNLIAVTNNNNYKNNNNFYGVVTQPCPMPVQGPLKGKLSEIENGAIIQKKL